MSIKYSLKVIFSFLELISLQNLEKPLFRKARILYRDIIIAITKGFKNKFLAVLWISGLKGEVYGHFKKNQKFY